MTDIRYPHGMSRDDKLFHVERLYIRTRDKLSDAEGEIAKSSVSGDPWAHRSQFMKCATCMWFVPKGDADLGRCRKKSPTLNGYPAVRLADWCGDHKIDEEKV